MPYIPFKKSIQKVVEKIVPASHTTYVRKEEGQVAGATKTAGTYTLNDRKVSANDEELRLLRAVIFSEVSNREPERQQFEARIIANTAFNRMIEQNRSLKEVLTQKNAYQGITNSQFPIAYNNTATDTLTQQKLQVLDGVMNEIKSGNFPDNTGGRVFYVHDDDGSGKIWLKEGRLGGWLDQYHELP